MEERASVAQTPQQTGEQSASTRKRSSTNTTTALANLDTKQQDTQQVVDINSQPEVDQYDPGLEDFLLLSDAEVDDDLPPSPPPQLSPQRCATATEAEQTPSQPAAGSPPTTPTTNSTTITSPTRPKRNVLKLCQFRGCDKVVPSRSLCSRHQKQKERATKRGQLHLFLASLVSVPRFVGTTLPAAPDASPPPIPSAGSEEDDLEADPDDEDEEEEERKDKGESGSRVEDGASRGRHDQADDLETRTGKEPLAAEDGEFSFDTTKYTKVEVTHLLRVPQRKAAARLGISSSTLSRLWRESKNVNNANGWTYKQVLSPTGNKTNILLVLVCSLSILVGVTLSSVSQPQNFR